MRRAVLCTVAQVSAPGWRSFAPLARCGLDLVCGDASWRPAASAHRLPVMRLLSSAAAEGQEQRTDGAEHSSVGSEDAHALAGTGAAAASRYDKKRVILTDNAAVVKALEHFIHGGKHPQAVDLWAQWRAGVLREEPDGPPRKYLPSVKAYSLFLAAKCHGLTGERIMAAPLEPLLQVLRELDERGTAPRAEVFEHHAKLARKRQHSQMGATLLAEARRRDLSLPFHVLSDILHSLCDAENRRNVGRLESVLEELSLKMADAKSLESNTGGTLRLREALSAAVNTALAWHNAAIAGFALRLLLQAGGKPAPTLVVDVLGVGVDRQDCELITFALTHLGPAAAAAIDQGTLVAVLNAAARKQHALLADQAWGALQQGARDHGTVPLPSAFAAAVAAQSACGNIDAAFSLVQEAYTTHPNMDARHSVWMPLVRACAGGPQALDGAYFLLERRKQAGSAVHVAALNVVVAACCLAGDIQRACETFDTFETVFGVSPTLDTFHLLLRACTWNGRAGSADKMQEELARSGLQQTHITRGHLIEADIGKRRLDLAVSRLAEAAAAQELPPRQTLARLRTALEEEQHREGLDLLQRALSDAGVKLF